MQLQAELLRCPDTQPAGRGCEPATKDETNTELENLESIENKPIIAQYSRHACSGHACARVPDTRTTTENINIAEKEDRFSLPLEVSKILDYASAGLVSSINRMT